MKIVKKIVWYGFVAPMIALGLFLAQEAEAKTIQFTNNTSETFKVRFAHFSSRFEVDRYPTISTFDLKPGDGGVKQVRVKPYEYMSDIYIPNVQWRDEAGKGSEEANKREKEILNNYSFALRGDEDEHFSIKLTDSKGNEYLFVHVSDRELGQLMQKMPEMPTSSDGVYVEKDFYTGEPKLTVVAGSAKKQYRANEYDW